MRIALDTNICCDFFAGKPQAIDVVRAATHVVILLPVLAELRAGFAFGNRTHENENILNTFLSQPAVLVISPDEVTSHFYSRIYKQLRTQGTPLPTNDLWIAALVEQHRLILSSRDQHFDHLPQLPRVG